MSIIFSNPGLIDLVGVKAFGVCAKETANPIGYFGTGLKYAIAVLLREGHTITLYRGKDKHTFSAKEYGVRKQKFTFVFMDDKPLAFTTALGRDWKVWMAFRELAANAYDEHGDVWRGEVIPSVKATHWVIDGRGIEEAYDERDTIFLDTDKKPAHTLRHVELYDDFDSGHYMFRKGIRVMRLPKRALFTYNLTEDIKITEDRTIASISDVYIDIARSIAASEDAALIRQILLADQRFWESTIDYHWWSVKPGEVFNTVVDRLYATRTSFNKSAGALYRRDNPKDPEPNTVQMETVPIEHRRRLWAALEFWKRLGYEIPKSLIRVTDGIDDMKYQVVNGNIFIATHTLARDMREITGLVYKAYAKTKPTIGGVKIEDLLLDTAVEFGERLLGVSQAQQKRA